MTIHKPMGFWEVVGHKPFTFCGVFIDNATFAVESSAVKFAEKHGGEVRHREADFIMMDGKVVWERLDFSTKKE